MLLIDQVSSLVSGFAATISLTTFEGFAATVRAADILAVHDLPALPKSTVYTGARAQVFFGAHSLVVRDTAKNVRALIDAAAASAAPASMAHLEDQKAIGTEGGTATNGAWRTRDINTEVSDVNNLVTLSANQITIQPGTYLVWAAANSLRTGFHQLRLRNITDSTTLLTGTNERSIDTDSTTTTATMAGRISLATSKVLELQHRVSTTRATFGWGADMQAGFDINVYSRIIFWKLP